MSHESAGRVIKVRDFRRAIDAFFAREMGVHPVADAAVILRVLAAMGEQGWEMFRNEVNAARKSEGQNLAGYPSPATQRDIKDEYLDRQARNKRSAELRRVS